MLNKSINVCCICQPFPLSRFRDPLANLSKTNHMTRVPMKPGTEVNSACICSSGSQGSIRWRDTRKYMNLRLLGEEYMKPGTTYYLSCNLLGKVTIFQSIALVLSSTLTNRLMCLILLSITVKSLQISLNIWPHL